MCLTLFLKVWSPSRAAKAEVVGVSAASAAIVGGFNAQRSQAPSPGKESDLFHFTLKHSLIFATFVGLITLAQAYWLTGILVK